MNDTSTFDEHRPLLFSIAYRMLGSASDAEVVVQDAWLRYQGASDVRSPRAFAATVVTRLCLDRLKSARVAREEYVGPWLPEPMLTTEEGPDVALQRTESVTLAFLVLLEALSPEERAVFILKEAFDYDHGEIAGMLGTTAEMQTGDASALGALLARDVGLWSDGGGKVPAARRPLVGRDEVLNFLVGLHRVAATTGIGAQL